MKGSTKFWLSLAVALFLKFLYYLYFQCYNKHFVEVMTITMIGAYFAYESIVMNEYFWANEDEKKYSKFNYSVFCWIAKGIKELNKLFDKYLTD